MRNRVFVLVLIGLTALVIVTGRPLLGAALQVKAATPVLSTVEGPTLSPIPATTTPTPDPFAALPMATPLGGGARTVSGLLPTPAFGTLPLVLTPTPTLPAHPGAVEGPTPSPAVVSETQTIGIPVAPLPAGPPPDRLTIPRLGLDAPVEPVGMIPSTVAPGVVEWEAPDHRAAGWLETSASFGLTGNTVLDGHHNVQGEVFRGLWTLEAGDEITLYAGTKARHYVVRDVLILPEKGQPLAVRLANARYIQPTADERLTLITCWPYENNTHRTVVVALPEAPR